MSETLLQTPLSAWHMASGAKMAPFAGWNMPIQYTGILAEHEHTRTQASIFDICHMGEFLVFGPGVKQALSMAVTHNLETLAEGRCRYGFILNENGGIIDDCIIYNLCADRYMIVVNGACEEKDFFALRSRLPEEIKLENISSCTAKIDVQGPAAPFALCNILDVDIKNIGYFNFRIVKWNTIDVIVSRTGYTGELGYELYLPWDCALEMWQALLTDKRIKPAGLGARDTLRLESGLPLYGQDLDEDHTPVEAGYEAMLTSAANYVGKDKLATINSRLIALKIDGRRSVRHYDKICLMSGEEVGFVTSASFVPTLGHAVALGWVKAEHDGQEKYILKAARFELEGLKTSLPFYTGTARNKL